MIIAPFSFLQRRKCVNSMEPTVWSDNLFYTFFFICDFAVKIHLGPLRVPKVVLHLYLYIK